MDFFAVFDAAINFQIYLCTYNMSFLHYNSTYKLSSRFISILNPSELGSSLTAVFKCLQGRSNQLSEENRRTLEVTE